MQKEDSIFALFVDGPLIGKVLGVKSGAEYVIFEHLDENIRQRCRIKYTRRSFLITEGDVLFERVPKFLRSGVYPIFCCNELPCSADVILLFSESFCKNEDHHQNPVSQTN